MAASERISLDVSLSGGCLNVENIRASLQQATDNSRAPKLRPGSSVCLCRSCGVYFQSVRAFEAHRVGPWDKRRCLTTPRMAERGLVLDPKGFWRWPKREYSAQSVAVAA